MIKIVLASSNPKKIGELQTLLMGTNFEIIPQSNFNISEADEPYDTFIENALVKARHASFHTNLPAIADDSGICVDSLNLLPGVRSARYAGDNASDIDNLNLLLQSLDGVVDRNAYYYSSIVFISSHLDPQPLICEGIWKGRITKSPRGNNGFGYDPIFEDIKTEKTAAELDTTLKNKLSHRGKALQQLIHKLKIKYEQE